MNLDFFISYIFFYVNLYFQILDIMMFLGDQSKLYLNIIFKMLCQIFIILTDMQRKQLG